VRGHLLHGTASPLGKRGAQRLVALDQEVEGLGQGRFVQRSVEAQGHGQVVGRAPGHQPVEEPQALLREGERRHERPGIAGQRPDTGLDPARRGGSVLPE
jgi:hypothetical protein